MPDRAFAPGPKILKPATGTQRKHLSEASSRNQSTVISEREITQGIAPIVRKIPQIRTGAPSLQSTTIARMEASSRLKINFQTIAQPTILAGRLAHFLPNWRLISSDPDVLVAVVGYKLELIEEPTQTCLPPVLHFSKAESAKIDAEILDLQQKGALNPVHSVPDQFISNLFLVPKRDGTSRPVFNLRG